MFYYESSTNGGVQHRMSNVFRDHTSDTGGIHRMLYGTTGMRIRSSSRMNTNVYPFY